MLLVTRQSRVESGIVYKYSTLKYGTQQRRTFSQVTFLNPRLRCYYLGHGHFLFHRNSLVQLELKGCIVE